MEVVTRKGGIIIKKFNIKITNHSHKILFIEGFPFILKAYPNFLRMYSFYFIEFSITKLFNVQQLLYYIIGLNIAKPHCVHPLFIKSFPTTLRTWWA
jgi:hypothetical protein